MLTIVCFKWNTPGYATFRPAHVHALQKMVAGHYPHPHRFLCITDDPDGLDCETYPLWSDYRTLKYPDRSRRGSSYTRLKLFDPAMRDVLGSRFVLLDLDACLLDDVSPLWNRQEDVVLWRCALSRKGYNGAMVLCDAGARPEVWQDFDPERSPVITHHLDYRGSDQAWISLKLQDEATWTEADGVHFINGPLQHKPDNARIVFTMAGTAPWTSNAPPWLREIYREYL